MLRTDPGTRDIVLKQSFPCRSYILMGGGAAEGERQKKWQDHVRELLSGMKEIG